MEASTETRTLSERTREIFSAIFDDRDLSDPYRYWTDESVDHFLAAGRSVRGAEALAQWFRDLFAAVEVWAPSSDRVVLPDDGDFADLDFAGFARAAVADLRLAAVDGDGAESARDALGLLHRLARSGG